MQFLRLRNSSYLVLQSLQIFALSEAVSESSGTIPEVIKELIQRIQAISNRASGNRYGKKFRKSQGLDLQDRRSKIQAVCQVRQAVVRGCEEWRTGAKRDQVPSHVIEKAIEKAKGGGGEDFVVARYEGFGPGGCSVIVDCLTDNNNRTITDVRSCFTRTGAKLGPTGSVSHSFDHLAVLSFKGDNADEVLEAMLNADVDVNDVECADGNVTLFAPANEFYKAKTALLEAFPEVELHVQEITFLPQADKEISPDDVPIFEKFMNLLHDCDDVQDIYHNAMLPN